ncbi:MAG TPA: hypothetical protein VM737_06090 [Gemmatimonadota bacterium]|nr:hypothetical protein [Gemmatimonadota bacterium]
MKKNMVVLQDGEAAYAAVRAGFGAALLARPDEAVEASYVLGGAPVRFRVVGSRLAEEIERVLAHLALGGQAAEGDFRAGPALTIDFWDAEAAGVPAPLRPVPEGLGPYGLTQATADGRYVADIRGGTIAVLDRSNGRIAGGTVSVHDMYLDERARPFHRLLSLWIRTRGVQYMHSALVAAEDEGILLTGAGGSGKSTTSLLCLQDGFDFLGDDFIGLERRRAGGFVGHSLYGSTVVGLSALEDFPQFTSRAVPPNAPGEEKWLIYLNDIYPERMRREVEIRALAVAKVVGRERTEVRPVSRKEAMLGLAPSSLMLMTGAGTSSFEVLCDLAAAIPCYRLELGRDMHDIPGVVAELLDGVPA